VHKRKTLSLTFEKRERTERRGESQNSKIKGCRIKQKSHQKKEQDAGGKVHEQGGKEDCRREEDLKLMKRGGKN